MDPPTQLFTGSQLAQPVTARATTGALEVGIRTRPEREPPQQRSLLPLVIGVAVVVVLALGLLVVLLLRNRDASDAARAPALDASTAAAPNPASGPLVLSPESPSTGSAATAAGSSPHVSVVPPSARSQAITPTSVIPPSPPALLRPTSATTAAAPAPAARSARCYSDPFTGQLRVAGSGHTSDGFPCRQNPFTGAYQRQ